MSKRKPTPPIESDQWRSVEEHDDPAAARAGARRASSPTAPASSTARRAASSCSSSAARWRSPASARSPAARIRRRRSCPYNVKPADVTPGKPAALRDGAHARRLRHRRAGDGVGRSPDQDRGQPRAPGRPRARRRRSTRPRSCRCTTTRRARELKQHGSGKSWKQFCHAIGEHARRAQGGRRRQAGVPRRAVGARRCWRRCRSASPPRSPRRAGTRTRPVSMDEAYEGARIAFGRPLETQLDLDQGQGGRLARRRLPRRLADVAVGAAPVGRAPRAGQPSMSRLYVAEATLSCTGMMADHRLRTRSSDVARLARALHAAVAGGSADAGDAKANAWVKAVAKDLARRRRRSGRRRRCRASRPRCTRWCTRSTRRSKSTAVSYTAPVLPTAYEPLAGARRRDQGRPRRHAGHHGVEPGLLRAGRRRLRAAPRQGAERDLSRLPRGRDRGRARRGSCRARTSSRAGATAAPPTARSRCSSRSSSRCSTASPSPSCGRPSSAKAASGGYNLAARGLSDARRGRLPAPAAEGRRRRQRAAEGDRRRCSRARSPARSTS